MYSLTKTQRTSITIKLSGGKLLGGGGGWGVGYRTGVLDSSCFPFLNELVYSICVCVLVCVFGFTCQYCADISTDR